MGGRFIYERVLNAGPLILSLKDFASSDTLETPNTPKAAVPTSAPSSPCQSAEYYRISGIAARHSGRYDASGSARARGALRASARGGRFAGLAAWRRLQPR